MRWFCIIIWTWNFLVLHYRVLTPHSPRSAVLKLCDSIYFWMWFTLANIKILCDVPMPLILEWAVACISSCFPTMFPTIKHKEMYSDCLLDCNSHNTIFTGKTLFFFCRNHASRLLKNRQRGTNLLRACSLLYISPQACSFSPSYMNFQYSFV